MLAENKLDGLELIANSEFKFQLSDSAKFSFNIFIYQTKAGTKIVVSENGIFT